MTSTSPEPPPGPAVSFAAVRTALTDLVDTNVLTEQQVGQVAARLQPLWSDPGPVAPNDQEHRQRTLVTEIAGYLGGALVLSGAAAVVIPTWTWVPAPVRFALALLVAALLAGGMAALWQSVAVRTEANQSPDARLRLASTLGALAAGAAAIAVAVPAPDPWEELTGSVAALAVALAGYVLVRGAPLLFTAWIATLTLVQSVLERADLDGLFVWVTVYAVLAAAWVVLGSRTWGDFAPEAGVAGLLGGLTGLGAAEAATTQGKVMAVYGLGLGMAFAGACFAIYLTSRRWSALVPAVLIALIVPATALAILFGSILGAGLTVAAVGLALLLVGWRALSQRPVA
jgi:MFS family permease